MITLEGKAALGEEAIEKEIYINTHIYDMTSPPAAWWGMVKLQHPLPNSLHDEGASDVVSGKHYHADRIISQLYLDAFKFREV